MAAEFTHINKVGNEAWVTLATNMSYMTGAMVLAASLRRVNTDRVIVVMTTEDTLKSISRQTLEPFFDQVVVVPEIHSGDAEHLALMDRPNLGVTFTKLHCWKLTQFDKCVFLDADTLVIQYCDELFDREEFSAAPDAGWPDCFNSGVFVFKPSMETYKNLIEFAAKEGSFDGGDQGLLNSYFSTWSTVDINKHLPFIYNMVASATYSYRPAYKHFRSKVKIVHFIGEVKPWMLNIDGEGRILNAGDNLADKSIEHIQTWFLIYYKDVFPKIDSITLGMGDRTGFYRKYRHDMEKRKASQIISKLSHMVPGAMIPNPPNERRYIPCSDGPIVSIEVPRRYNRREDWERGNPDYSGAASFDQLLETMTLNMSPRQ